MPSNLAPVRLVVAPANPPVRLRCDRDGRFAGCCNSPLSSFFVLSCLFSWWPAALGAAGWSSADGLAGFGPFLAAVLVLALTEGRGGVRDLLSGWSGGGWRLGPMSWRSVSPSSSPGRRSA
jgi:hypothetical protein